MINPLEFSSPIAPSEVAQISSHEHIKFSEIVDRHLFETSLDDLILQGGLHSSALKANKSRSNAERGGLVCTLLQLAALIAMKESAREMATNRLRQGSRARAPRMHPLRLAACVLFESKQNAHNYARAASEILHRNIDFTEVTEKFSSGELDLRILGAAYDKRVRPGSSAKEQSAVVTEAMPLHDAVDDVVVSGDDSVKDGSVDIPADCGSESALPVSLDLTETVRRPEIEPEAAMSEKFMTDAKAEIAQIKLSINPALLCIAPLKAGQRYIAEFTLEQDDAGIVTALRTARSQFKYTTTKVHRQRP